MLAGAAPSLPQGEGVTGKGPPRLLLFNAAHATHPDGAGGRECSSAPQVRWQVPSLPHLTKC